MVSHAPTHLSQTLDPPLLQNIYTKYLDIIDFEIHILFEILVWYSTDNNLW
jgi:hypothetical protein